VSPEQILPSVTHQTTKILPTVVPIQNSKLNQLRCFKCRKKIRFCFSTELGRSLRLLVKKNFKGKHDSHRNLGRDPPTFLR
jgi:hypothetical protein